MPVVVAMAEWLAHALQTIRGLGHSAKEAKALSWQALEVDRAAHGRPQSSQAQFEEFDVISEVELACSQFVGIGDFPQHAKVKLGDARKWLCSAGSPVLAG